MSRNNWDSGARTEKPKVKQQKQEYEDTTLGAPQLTGSTHVPYPLEPLLFSLQEGRGRSKITISVYKKDER